MSEHLCIPFQFHVTSARRVSADEAARIQPSSWLRLGSRGDQFPVDVELHGSPELDRLVRETERADQAERLEAAKVALQRYAESRIAALSQPRTSTGLSRPAEALYRNILPPAPGSSAS